MSVKALLASAPSGRSRPLLIDDTEYSTSVIRHGAPIPWADAALLANHFGQVVSLLDPDALWVDIQNLQACYLAGHPGLADAMAERTRTGYPLRVLLGDEGGLAATVEVLETLPKASRRQLVLQLPSPASWLSWAHEVAGNPVDGVDSDAADRASMYIAEWLGRLGASPVAIVLLDSRRMSSDAPERLAPYTAITNVAAHFDWSVAMWGKTGIEAMPGDPSLGVIPAEYWTGGTVIPDADLLVAEIPGSAVPEQVLDLLAKLR